MDRDKLQENRDIYDAAFSKEIDEFEKNLLLLAAGILTFTITFIKDIVGIGNYDHTIFLFGGWISLGLAILGIVASFFKSAHTSERISKHIDKCIDNLEKSKKKKLHPKDEEKLWNWIKNKVRRTNTYLFFYRVFSISTFFIGLFLIGLFVAINFENGSKKTDQAKSTGIILEGATITHTDSTLIIKIPENGINGTKKR
jgi:hypothetical protein